MRAAIEKAKMEQDSVGGIVECFVLNMPAGIGDPIFDCAESVISSLLFAIPAVKGVEFGAGFGASTLKGSENNDAFYLDNTGKIKTKTNHHGGILGGITSGMPIHFKVAFKPTPSIGKEQETVDFISRTNTTIQIRGRHDPCVAVRAVPCVEAAAAIAMTELLL